MIIAGGSWRCDGNPKTLNVDSVMSIICPASMEVVDSAGVLMGRVLNNSPLDYDDFRVALCNCYGDSPLPARFVRRVSERMDKEGLVCWYEVQIVADPLKEVTDAQHAKAKNTPRRRPALKSVPSRPE